VVNVGDAATRVRPSGTAPLLLGTEATRTQAQARVDVHVRGILPSVGAGPQALQSDTLFVMCLIVQRVGWTDDAHEEVTTVTSIARPQPLWTTSVPIAESITAVALLTGALALIALGLLPPDVANPWHLLPGAPDLAPRSLV
jgi:hypothetical protein